MLFRSSRGHLVSSFLAPDAPDWQQYATALADSDADYAGFNLLLLTPRIQAEGGLSYDAALVTNSGGGGRISSKQLDIEERRVGALSNGVEAAGGPDWPKVKKGRSDLQDILFASDAESGNMLPGEQELAERLFDLLWYMVFRMYCLGVILIEVVVGNHGHHQPIDMGFAHQSRSLQYK